MIALAVAIPKKSFKIALYCTTASVLGAMLGYAIGMFFFDAVANRIIDFYGIHEQFEYVAQKYSDNAFAAITIAGFTFIPYKVFTIAAGVFHVNIFVFFFASILSRGARFFLLAALIYRVGPTIKLYIDKYFALFAIGFVLLLGLGFAIVKYFI